MLRTPILAAALGLATTLPTASSAQDFYIGQVMLTAATYCPRDFLEANGQTLSIAQNNALFALLGCTFGGDCQTTFNLPDLRGRAPVQHGQAPGLANYTFGQPGGSETFTIRTENLPPHSHELMADEEAADTTDPSGALLAEGVAAYNTAGNSPVAMKGNAIAPTGNGQPVTARGPYLAMRWCIATQGIFPPRN